HGRLPHFVLGDFRRRAERHSSVSEWPNSVHGARCAAATPAQPGPSLSGSERNLVVEILHRRPALAAAGACGAATAGSGQFLRRRLIGIAAAIASAAAPVEHGELAAIALQHDLRRVALLARIVGPFARLEGALEIDLGTLLQVLFDDLHELVVEDNDAVPLGALLALAARLVAPALGGGDGKIGDPRPVLGRADLGIPAEVADEDHLVDASGHAACLPSVGFVGAALACRPRILAPGTTAAQRLWSSCDVIPI